jgi:small-conductance mechanosensitive channel
MNENLFADLMRWVATSGLAILITTLLAVAGLVSSNFVFERLLKTLKLKITDTDSLKRIQTVFSLFKKVISTAIFTIAALMILSEFGMDLAPVLTTVGILGLAVSFGAQTLVKDIISGLFILLENNIRIGDTVTISGITGTVEDIRLRTLALRDLQGNLHIFPNGSINEICNMSREFSVAVFNIGISYDSDIEKATKLMAEEGEKIATSDDFSGKILNTFEIHGIQELADSAVVIRATLKTIPSAKWLVYREYLKRIKIRFDQEGITIPFRTIKLVKD